MTPVQAMSFEKAAKLFVCKSHFPVFQLCCNVCVDHWVVLPYCGYRCKGDVIWGTSVVWPRKGIRFLTARNTKLLLCHWGSMNVFRIPMQLVSWWGNKRVVNRRRSHGSIIASRSCIVGYWKHQHSASTRSPGSQTTRSTPIGCGSYRPTTFL